MSIAPPWCRVKVQEANPRPAGGVLDARRAIHYQTRMPALLAQETAEATASLPTEDPTAILAILLGVLAVIFWATRHPATSRFFRAVPPLVFCYFIPTALTTCGILPAESVLYDWTKSFVLPASLLLLILALDVPGIIGLGWKAIVMLLAGTFGVIVGGPLALWACGPLLPADAWRGMAALSGSWIGGGANFVAMGQIAGTDPTMLSTMVIPDVFVANIWMGVLLYLSGHQESIDRWTGADTRAIHELKQRMTDFHERTNRIATVPELMFIFALGFGISWLSGFVADRLPEIGTARSGTMISSTTWKYVLVTTIGVAFSFTKLRNLDGAGASRIGTVMLYLLVACIGASADFRLIAKSPALIRMGFVWISVHIAVLLTVGRLIRAPLFYVAVGSQANIGGAASAPIVAAAFHESLAPVGVLLAVAGYVLGTYGGIACMRLLMAVAGASG